ncbi:MAG: hypothetical protein WBE11_15100 [Candidatus Aminicenantaceae bacterium]
MTRTKNEEIILLSILRLQGNAYGVSIKKQIQELLIAAEERGEYF